MARPMLASDLVDEGRPAALTFDDVPPEFRPSNWRRWLGKVKTRHVAEALVSEIEEKRAREMAASEMRSDAYCQWLADHDLATPSGRPLRGWDSTSLARWEDSQ
ncbi:hypothetical protein [Rhodococcus sp. 15-649-2-2]|uniref:hypothetical protein n=1 Tax=Rhodococcus sp. 15-649-2-2 TaxID=2023140 RepID=UPI00117A3BF6|nr:hypothetical protein [Rhodococcus sp. 15-649-2-2]